MNSIKFKLRNSTLQDLLEAVMSVRAYMAIDIMCCNTFVPTSDMLTLICTKAVEYPEMKFTSISESECSLFIEKL
jgi:hypothetical protein